MPTPPRFPQPKLLLSSIAIAVLTLMNQASAQQGDGGMTRIEVTGSSIKRLASENALPLTTIKAEDLVNRGLTTMSEVATSLTAGATNEPVGGGGGGTMINMRGLNTNRTLVLLNGRRLANEAIGDSAINVDVIPMNAIERVEVLRDGASAIYGTDAIAGVVNFITKRAISDTTASASVMAPERSGGGEQRRFSLTSGTGDLAKDGWNVYAAFDTQKRSALMQRDRPNISDPDDIARLGGTAFTSNTSGSSSAPANYTVYANGKPTSVTGNPYFGAGCVAPYQGQYTIPSTKPSGAGSKTCVLDPNLYPQLLADNKQTTLLTKGSLRHGDGNLLTVELLSSESYIDALNPPQPFGAQTDYDKLNPGLRKPLMITKASKWYPGGAGGVPAVAGLNGADLALTWSLDELGPAITDDRQNSHRLVLTEEGQFKGWDYKAGFNYAYSKRTVTFLSGYLRTPELYKGVADGVFNPFGPQDAAGQAYLESISADGLVNRRAEVHYYGPDLTLNRELTTLGGGALALAVGADLHRETYRDASGDIGDAVVYKVSGTPNRYPHGARTVLGTYLELDAPFTKQLNLNLAVRADRFSDFGTTFNPKASVRYEPSRALMLRATASTGFRAPTLPELYGTPQTRVPSTSKWDDPLLCPSATPGVSGTGALTTDPKYAGLNLDAAKVCGSTLTVLTGANPDLEPEKSKTFTAGIVIEPIKNLVASLDFWNVEMTGTIAQISEDTIFGDVNKYNNLFVRNADGTLAYITKTRLNMGGLRTQGIDASLNYTLPTASMGRFGMSFDGTYVNKYEGQNEEGGDWIDSVGKPGALSTGATSANTYVFKWKHNLRLSWSRGGFGTQLTQSYTSRYIDTNALPSQKPGQPFYNEIEPYILYNLSANYAWNKRLKFTFGVNNLLDVDPPLSNQRLSSRVVFAQNIAKPIGRAYNIRVNYTF
ncbi:TonB-dependent receptor [Massilia sp. CCM 8734]|uniref:TonB-dependent receptor n=1 Tax=Massilia sp. CCM 8734 TaxID=2609283 RepID=UPI00141DB019|nr:TonB-dependent receptor [Massilia sp. CCM 8734]